MLAEARASDRRAGSHLVPVRALTTADVDIARIRPQPARVVLEDVVSKRMEIKPVLTGQAPLGYAILDTSVWPTDVRLRGPKSIVAQAKQVVLSLDRSAVVLEMPQSGLLRALDARGKEVNGVELSPNVATARLKVQRTIAPRTVPVFVQTTGAPAPGYRIVRATVEPQLVTVVGEVQEVRNLQAVLTGVVPLEGADHSFTRTVPLILPEGVSNISAREARVSVRIAPAPPAPTPANP